MENIIETSQSKEMLINKLEKRATWANDIKGG